jgi:predicted alpha/beta hydrolase family esterase
MITIILPGYSPRNKDWAEDLAKTMKLGHKVSVHNWRHWGKGGSLSQKYESEKIIEELGEDSTNIIAKSVGTFVAALLIPSIKEKILKIILCGIPSVSEARKEKYKEALKNFPGENVICFQNNGDPFASYLEVKSFMTDVNPKIKVIKKERNDHHYPYSEEFGSFLNG